MVTITSLYDGGLRCTATHGPSGVTLITDAPVDNHGKGESFSPTDLVATAVANCMMTVMGIAAERHGIDLKGTSVTIGKEMSSDLPRRIVGLRSMMTIPLSADHPQRAACSVATDKLTADNSQRATRNGPSVAARGRPVARRTL